MLADGTQLPFYFIIHQFIWVRENRAEEVFVVSRVSKDAILEMTYLTAHNCSLDVDRPVLLVDGKELTRTDRHDRLLVSKIQVIVRW